MKPLLPLALVIASGLLYGCPDTKIPKGPPSIPEPKASIVNPTPALLPASDAGVSAT